MNGIGYRAAAITAVVVAVLVAPSGATAATFCVSKPACVAAGGTDAPTVQVAVMASNGNGSAEQDRIEIGTGSFAGPTTGTATPVDIVGEGPAATTINGSPGAGTPTLLVGGTSSVSALQIVQDANDLAALRLVSSSPAQPSRASNLLVTGTAAPAGAAGVQLEGGSTLSDSTVNMIVGSPSTAVTTQGGSIERSRLEGDIGLIGTGIHRRLSIVASSIGARPGSDGGNLTLDQSTIRMTAAGTALLVPQVPPPLNTRLSLVASHVTAVGPGTGTGASVAASCVVTPGISTLLQLRNTILRGFTTDRHREGVLDCNPVSAGNQSAGGLLESTHSIFDPAKTTENGPGGFFENSIAIAPGVLGTTNLNVDPLFVNAGGFDFRLGVGSQAIDSGDPAALSGSESPVDLDGNARVADGNSDGTPRRDIGAFEFPAPDGDGDGVPDTADACPGVNAPTANGCPDPGGGGGGGDGGDKTPPSVTLGGRKKQPGDGTIEVKVSCDEACSASGGGTLKVPVQPSGGGKSPAKARVKKFPLREASASIQAGGSTVLKLKLSKKGNRAALKALNQGGRVKADVTVEASDAAGNATQASETVRLVKQKRAP